MNNKTIKIKKNKIGAGRVERERKAWTNGILDHLPLRWQKLSRPISA
jgi:hypothetical protein